MRFLGYGYCKAQKVLVSTVDLVLIRGYVQLNWGNLFQENLSEFIGSNQRHDKKLGDEVAEKNHEVKALTFSNNFSEI